MQQNVILQNYLEKKSKSTVTKAWHKRLYTLRGDIITYPHLFVFFLMIILPSLIDIDILLLFTTSSTSMSLIVCVDYCRYLKNATDKGDILLQYHTVVLPPVRKYVISFFFLFCLFSLHFSYYSFTQDKVYFKIVTSNKKYRFRCEDEKVADMWVSTCRNIVKQKSRMPRLLEPPFCFIIFLFNFRHLLFFYFLLLLVFILIIKNV